MALPTSGQLSFSMIAGELGVGTPFSLRNMSSNAGFGTPDGVYDFYGYSAGGGLTLFFRNDETNLADNVCINNARCFIPAWHNGQFPLPEVGDTVYEDEGGNIPLLANSGGWFGMSEIQGEPPFRAFRIFKTQGRIVEEAYCFLNEPNKL
jgi:hypothetical protein